MAVLRDRPYTGFNFLVDLGDGVTDVPRAGFQGHPRGRAGDPRPAAAALNWRATESLPQFLLRGGVVAIADIDTRRLTRILREKGAQAGCIASGEAASRPDLAVAAARRFPGLKGMDLAKVVSTKRSFPWNEGTNWALEQGPRRRPGQRLHVVAYDFGIERNILRLLADHGCRMTVVPAQTPAAEVLALSPDGVFLSNGPGHPEPCDYAIESIRSFLDAGS